MRYPDQGLARIYSCPQLQSLEHGLVKLIESLSSILPKSTYTSHFKMTVVKELSLVLASHVLCLIDNSIRHPRELTAEILLIALERNNRVAI